MTDHIKSSKIGVHILGGISVGKSTCMNSLLGDYIMETNRSRNTITTSGLIIDNTTTDTGCEVGLIAGKINDRNRELLEKEQSGVPLEKRDITIDEVYTELKIPDLGNLITPLVIYDSPGMNDINTSTYCMANFDNNINNINIIVYVLDFTRGLNTEDDKKMLTHVLRKTAISKANKKHISHSIIFAVNKCDDMTLDIYHDRYMMDFDDEGREAYARIVTDLEIYIKKYNQDLDIG